MSMQKCIVISNDQGSKDISSTINSYLEKGWKVVSYESYCGGLPVAEHATNPMGYKFSWNPGAAIKASRNPASFKRDGKKVQTN